MAGGHAPFAPLNLLLHLQQKVTVSGWETRNWTARLDRPGFMQAGGGAITATLTPLHRRKKLDLVERGEPQETFGRVLHAHLAADIARREIGAAATTLNWPESKFDLRYATDGPGPGNAIMLGARFTQVCEISSGIAQLGTSAESVGNSAAKALRTYLASFAPAGANLADRLLLPMALARGGRFRTLKPTHHTRTNISLIEQFLPVRFSIEHIAPGVHAVQARPA